jgi:hypothetical protein
VVGDLDAEDLSRLHELFGERDIGRTWLGVSRGVVVDEHHRRRVGDDRFAEHLRGAEVHRADVALVDKDHVDDTATGVQQDDPHLLLEEVLHFRPHELIDVRRPGHATPERTAASDGATVGAQLGKEAEVLLHEVDEGGIATLL